MSNLWPVVQPHISGVKLAKMVEDVFDLGQYEVVLPYVALSEQAEAQKMAQVLQEQIMKSGSTATGHGGDYDLHPMQQQMIDQQTMAQMQQGQ
jgi:hypothetical protein